MTNNFTLKNQKGFSLISTVIASAIGIIVIGTISKIIVSQNQSVAYLEDRLSKTGLKSSLQTLLTPVACQNTFAGNSVPALTHFKSITEIRDFKNKVFYQIPMPDGSLPTFEKLNIEKMELYNVSVATGANSSGTMKLVVFPVRARGMRGVEVAGAQLSPIEIDLHVTTDSSGAISQCSTTGNPLVLIPGQMPCIVAVTRKTTGIIPPGGFGVGGSHFMKSSYTDNIEIFPHGTTGILDYSFSPGWSGCWGTTEKVFLDTFRCEDKKLIRTAQIDTGESVFVTYTPSSCGP